MLPTPFISALTCPVTNINQRNSEKLLRECRELLEQDLGEFIEELGPVIAEEMLVLIDSSRDDAKKTQYLRLRTDLKNRWQTLSAAYREELTKQLQTDKIVETSQRELPSFAELQLVNDKDLTEQIVMREFVARVREACSEETYALDRRIGHLTGREEQDDGDNQLGPATVCSAVHAGCLVMYEDLDQRTLLLRQMERHLQSELPQLYRVINEVLIEAGILPTLKRSYRSSAQLGPQAAAADTANIMSTLQRLAHARSQGVGGEGIPSGSRTNAGSTGNGGPRTVSSIRGEAQSCDTAFFESLQVFQASPAATPGALTNVVRLARDSDGARQIQPLEAITLDIVAILFDLIFNDDKVPNVIKGLISRLQIPVLKVALLDQQFFADRSHPARRFLDSISGITIRWGKTVDEGDPFYIKLSQLVERIQSTFDQNADIFGTSITELAAFVNENEAMEVETSRVVAEIVERNESELNSQHEQLANARQVANQALLPLIEPGLPKFIERFLLGFWQDVLQKHAHLSETDNAFHDAENIARELVWSVAPKRNADDRKRQVAMLPNLLNGLNQGLDKIAADADARRKFMDSLVDLHLAVLRGEREPKEVVEPEVSPPVMVPVIELQVTHTVENGVRIEQVSLPELDVLVDGSPQDHSNLRRVKHLVRGDWVEFIDENSQGRRERLTWISPKRSIFLFSNHASKCAISITPEALAHRLKKETARIVGRDTPMMFERALDSAFKTLDQTAEGYSK